MNTDILNLAQESQIAVFLVSESITKNDTTGKTEWCRLYDVHVHTKKTTTLLHCSFTSHLSFLGPLIN